jgi:hypothetical protein
MISCKTGSGHLTEKTGSEDKASHSQYGEQVKLKLFLADFARSVETGDWDRALSFFDRENYLGQVSIGIGMHQYLIEGMMLPAEEFLDDNNSLNINHLKGLAVNKISYEADDCYAEVGGEAFLSSGRKVPFTLRIIKDAKGEFTINPPVG